MTPSEIVSVTRNDATAEFEVIDSQNACQPPPAACHRIAASGSSTMTLSHIDAAPTRSAVRPVPTAENAGRLTTVPGEFGPGGLGVREQLSSSGLLVDLRDASVVLIEQ